VADPCVTSAATVASYSPGLFGEASLTKLVGRLREQTTDVHNGNLRGAESTLVAQASALNGIFAELARRAALNMAQNLAAMDLYMKLALRAQNQCRMTLETLATIKNPPVVFAKQANIANNQQVNNGPVVPATGAGETGKSQPEQSRLTHDARQSLDFGAPAHAIGSDTALATVGEINGAENCGR
jgi:hypothetical protein